MWFWGTVVVARSPILLADRADLLEFGYQHRRLHEFAAGTSAPVLAAYVCDCDCAAVFARLPDGWTDHAHLVPDDVDCGYEHRPRPPARAVADAVSGLAAAGAPHPTAFDIFRPPHSYVVGAFRYRHAGTEPRGASPGGPGPPPRRRGRGRAPPSSWSGDLWTALHHDGAEPTMNRVMRLP